MDFIYNMTDYANEEEAYKASFEFKLKQRAESLLEWAVEQPNYRTRANYADVVDKKNEFAFGNLLCDVLVVNNRCPLADSNTNLLQDKHYRTDLPQYLSETHGCNCPKTNLNNLKKLYDHTVVKLGGQGSKHLNDLMSLNYGFPPGFFSLEET